MSQVPVVYEKKLDADWNLAITESSIFFEGRGAVQETLRRIANELTRLGIAYAVVGGMALFKHGYRRYTEDIDLLVTSEGLKRVHEQLDGRGYLPASEGSRNLRDTQSGVKIEFRVAGQFPGDGKPKPVAFPDPARCDVVMDGISYLNLPTIFNLKLASGLSSAGRVKDLADCQELMKAIDLPRSFSTQLDPFVHAKFNELWDGCHE